MDNLNIIKFKLINYIQPIYQKIKDIFYPHNVIKLNKLDNEYQDIDTLMEEAIFQLLDNFFQEEQPLNLCTKKTKKIISVQEHLAMLEEAYGPENIDKFLDGCPEHEKQAVTKYSQDAYVLYTKLLNILDWYRTGGLKICGPSVYLAAVNSGLCHEEALKLEEETEKQITDNLLFVVQNRNKLWT